MGVGEFKYAIWIFKVVKGAAMATKFGKNKAKLQLLQFYAKSEAFFTWIAGFSGSGVARNFL